MLYPWLAQTFSHMMESACRGSSHHAIMIVGSDGAGKANLVQTYVESRLCTNRKDHFRCGVCQSCKLFDAKTHPDVFYVANLDEANTITVDRVREVIGFCSQKPYAGQYKCVVIPRAESMNQHSSNALLKVLEEPPKHTFFAITASHTKKVLPTISSRCQHIHLKVPSVNQAKHWLAEQGCEGVQADVRLSISQGLPLFARDITDEYLSQRRDFFNGMVAICRGEVSPVTVAKNAADMSLKSIFFWLATFLQDFVYIKLDKIQLTTHKDMLSELRASCNVLKYKALFGLMGQVSHYKRQLEMGANLNSTLVIEKLLIEWQLISRHHEYRKS